MKKNKRHHDSGNVTVGLILLVIGSILLLQKTGFFIPGWILSWPMILIAIGLVILIKHKFQSGFGAFMLLFGAFFLIKREFMFPFAIEQYLVPVGLILLGLFIMLKKKNRHFDKWKEWDHLEHSFQQKKNADGDSSSDEKKEGRAFDRNDGDLINSQALFCGIQKRVLSKNFKGGKASAIFGGTEIDLSQADLAEFAFLDIEVAFGGLKLVIPPHWDLQINVTNVFAGIEDKRMFQATTPDPSKVLRINGTIVFGGLEIKSF